jgi:hypothetical protein
MGKSFLTMTAIVCIMVSAQAQSLAQVVSNYEQAVGRVENIAAIICSSPQYNDYDWKNATEQVQQMSNAWLQVAQHPKYDEEGGQYAQRMSSCRSRERAVQARLTEWAQKHERSKWEGKQSDDAANKNYQSNQWLKEKGLK